MLRHRVRGLLLKYAPKQVDVKRETSLGRKGLGYDDSGLQGLAPKLTAIIKDYDGKPPVGPLDLIVGDLETVGALEDLLWDRIPDKNKEEQP
jgi:hypothetical protein